MEDPITGHFPTRIQDDEEEERAAQEWAQELDIAPSFEWSTIAQGDLREGKLHTELLVLATSQSACTLLEQCVHHEEVVASMQQPEILVGAPIALRSLVEGSTGRDSRCALCAAPGGAPGDALVALCRANITPERAVAWTAGLFAHVQPQRVVCVSALQAQRFLGEQDATQEALHFTVETSHSQGSLRHGIPLLPSGNLVPGLPAAVASYCQVHSVPATLMVSVEASPLPDSIAMRALARAMTSLLQHTGATRLRESLSDAVISEACKQMRKAVRLSDRAALYI